MINNTAQAGRPDYFDRIQVKQTLKKGDVVNYMVGGNEAVDAVDAETKDSITSCTIQAPTRYTTARVLYYDCYASAADWSTPNGSVPYTFVVSPFTDLVKVDLNSRTSEIYHPETDGVQDILATSKHSDDNNWYNLAGQRVINPSKGIFIHNGKKVVVK